MRSKSIGPVDLGTFHSAVEMKIFVRPAHTFRSHSNLHAVIPTVGEVQSALHHSGAAQSVNFALSLGLSLPLSFFPFRLSLPVRSAFDYLLCPHYQPSSTSLTSWIRYVPNSKPWILRTVPSAARPDILSLVSTVFEPLQDLISPLQRPPYPQTSYRLAYSQDYQWPLSD